MAPSRNIAEFFMPYVQKRKKVVDTTSKDRDESLGVESKNEIRKTAGASILSKNKSSNNQHSANVSFSSVLTSFSSAPPSPRPARNDETRPRIRRQLSPLSSHSSTNPSRSPSRSPRRSRSPQPQLCKQPAISSSFTQPAPSDISSLPPISSQSSSRRLVRNGQMVVTNSDSDSRDQDDDDSLDEIEDLIRKKRMKMTTTPAPATQDTIAGATALRSSARQKWATKVRKPSSPPRKKYRFDLASLAKQSKVEAEWGEKQKAYEKQQLDVIKEEKQQILKSASALDQITNQLNQEEGHVQDKNEIVRAMKRMDALQQDIQYTFFNPTDHLYQPPPEFPKLLTKDNKYWGTIMKTKPSRDHAFISGFVSDMATMLPLPHELVEWLLQQLLYENQPRLSLAYVAALEAHIQKTAIASLESLRESLLSLAGRQNIDLGADVESHPISLVNQDGKQTLDLLMAIKRSSLLVRKVANKLPIDEQRAWLKLLMLILLDHRVQKDITVRTEVQQSLNALMDAVLPARFNATVRSVGLSTLKSIKNPILLHRLLFSLPSTSSAMHMFKRRLAIAYTMKTENHLIDDLDRISLISSVTAQLAKNAKFKARESTDFAAMGARIGILDIGIGAGFSDFSFLPPLNNKNNGENHNDNSNDNENNDDNEDDDEKADSPFANSNSNSVFVQRRQRRSLPNEEETAFNAAIDALVAELRLVASNIRDAGAAHMQRTECKGMLENLLYRLEYAARTRPRPKKSVFDRRSVGGVAESAILTSYLIRREGEEGERENDEQEI